MFRSDISALDGLCGKGDFHSTGGQEDAGRSKASALLSTEKGERAAKKRPLAGH